MEIRLRPASAGELPALLERARDEYADELERQASLTREEACAKAERDFAGVLENGLPDGDVLFVIEDAEGAPVGRLRYAPREEHGRTILFLYDIHVNEERRGEGIGREAMAWFEERARELGAAQIAFNVWGGNEAGRRFYRSLGYEELSVFMGKRL